MNNTIETLGKDWNRHFTKEGRMITSAWKDAQHHYPLGKYTLKP